MSPHFQWQKPFTFFLVDGQTVLRLAFGFFLLSPLFIILCFSEDRWLWPNLHEWIQSFIFTFCQAFTSAFFTLLVGILGGFGLLGCIGSRWKSVLDFLCLIPVFLPSLYIILSLLNITNLLKINIFNFFGIILVHVIMYSGIVSLGFYRLVTIKVGSMIELARVEGASRWQMISRGIFPFLFSDLKVLFFYLLAIFFSSFSVPLILGNTDGITLEVLIYEKIRLGDGWSIPLIISWWQIGILFLLSLFVGASAETYFKKKAAPLLHAKSFGCRILLVFPIGFTMIHLFGQFYGVIEGWRSIFQSPALLSEISYLIKGTFFVGLGTGLMIYWFLLLLASLSPHRGLDRFLVGYSSPSPVLTGFAILLLIGKLGWDNWISAHLFLIFGLVLLMLSSLYRLLARGVLKNIERQVIVGRVASANEGLIFRKIIKPQVSSSFLWLAGLGAFWACGDFALSTLIMDRDTTLALGVKSYMSSYHLQKALALNFLLLICGGVCLLIFGGWSFVYRQKSLS